MDSNRIAEASETIRPHPQAVVFVIFTKGNDLLRNGRTGRIAEFF
jgi:hypothetical protein